MRLLLKRVITVIAALTALTFASAFQLGCSSCSAEIEWSEASSRIGDTVTVQGPVVGSAYLPEENGSPTFLNLGRDFPSGDRFTVVIWDGDRGDFETAPEDLFAGEKVVVTGTVSEYNGIPQIEVSDPSQIEVCG
jgi:DNA/RNA endonuclease YhcR with UshA esterase domain